MTQDSPLINIFKTRAGKFFLSLYCLTFAFYFVSCIGIYIIDPEVGRVELHFVSTGFFNIKPSLILWSLFHCILVGFFFPLSKTWIAREWNTSLLLCLGSVLLPTLMLSSSFILCFAVEMGLLCKIFIGMEAIRLSMKVISFTSESGRKLTVQQRQHFKNIDHNQNNLQSPVNTQSNLDLKMSHFVYFLFCPTAIYRDSYPRKETRKWSRLLSYILLLLSFIFIGLKLAVATSAPFFESKSTGVSVSLVIRASPLIIFTTLYTVLIGVGIAFLEVWSNIFAEVLRFGDCGFYQDWWTQHDILAFLVKWNNINQNWLFEYIYEPFRQKYGKAFAGLIVMAVSGFFHDFIFISTFSIFIPLCSGGQMTAWLVSQLLPHRKKNPASAVIDKQEEKVPSLMTFVGSTYNFFGFAVIYLFCQLEYYSRKTCPSQETGDLLSLMTPRLFTCLEWD